MPLATRRSYAGAAPACTLSSDISAGATSFSITGTTTNWPTTATGPFYMVIDPGLSTEEKVLVGARTSGSLSTVTRGVDGTTAASHVTGATCYPVFTAVDANDANLLASRLTAKGDLISSDGSDPTKVAVGSNNTRLVADSAQTSGIKWVADTQNTVVDAKGDLIAGTANDTVARLAVGTDNQRLVAASGQATGLNWVSDTQNTVVDAKGDLLVGTANDTVARVAVGANGRVLEADSAQTAGVKWGDPMGLVFVKQVTVGTSVSSVDVTSCFNSTFDNYRIVYSNINGSTNHDLTTVLLSSTTPSTTAYYRGFIYVNLATNALTGAALQNAGSFPISSTSTTSFRHAGVIEFYMPNLAQYTGIWSTNYLMRTDITSPGVSGSHQVATAYDGFRISTSAGTITGGTITVYGYRLG